MTRPFLAASLAAALLVLVRSAPHVLFEGSHFDSDMAIFGIMGLDHHGQRLPGAPAAAIPLPAGRKVIGMSTARQIAANSPPTMSQIRPLEVVRASWLRMRVGSSLMFSR